MKSRRLSAIVTILRTNLSAAILLVWGFGLFLCGIFLSNIGHYSLSIIGGIFIAAGLCGFAYTMVKDAVSAKHQHDRMQAEDVSFDADAAIAGHLKSAKRKDGVGAPKARLAAGRPVFGRKSA